jgi:O-antigen/teichoic acid export membrane protein
LKQVVGNRYVLTIRAFLGRFGHINWAIGDQALVSGCNFLTGVLLARYIGIEEFGRYVLAWIFVEFAAMLQHSLIVSPMMSISPKQAPEKMPSYLGALVIQSGCFLGIVFLAMIGGVYVLDAIQPGNDLKSLALALACAACAHQLQDLLRRYFFARFKPALALLSDFIRYGSQIALIVLLFYFRVLDAVAALWVTVLSSLVAAAVSVFFIEKLTYSIMELKATTLRHWRFSKWMTLSELMRWTSGDLFLVISGSLLGASTVGALRATRHLVGVSHIFILGLNNVMPVQASRHLHENGPAALKRYVKRMSAIGGALMLVVVIVASAAPEFWLRVVYGPQYAGYGDFVRLWSLIFFLNFLGHPLAAGLRAMERTQCLFHAYFVSSVLSVSLVYPLIQWFGVVGMLWGIIGIQILHLIVLIAGFRRHDRKSQVSQDTAPGKIEPSRGANLD